MKKTMGTFRAKNLDKIEKLFAGFTQREKRLYGKICNSTDPMVYFNGILDSFELYEIEVSDSFLDLWECMIEYFFME